MMMAILNIDGKEWLTIDTVSEILSEKAGRQVTPSSIRKMASDGRLNWRALDARTNVYDADQVRTYRMRPYQRRVEQV